jgi:phosphoglycerate dehydrogenase-like enzyme
VREHVHAWVPYAEFVSALPAGVHADVYDGQGEPPAGRDTVEFFVAPYTFDRRPLLLMAEMPALKVVQLLTAGYEHVLPYMPAQARLFRGGGIHDASTAELAVTLTLAALRGIPDFALGQRAHEWRHGRYEALADKRVLIVGYGGVGAGVEQRLAGFEVEVTRVAAAARAGVHAVAELPDLLPHADVVILTLPLTAATKGLVGKDFLARMPDGALLVNVARGGVVDTAALVDELNSGRLRAALDVTDPEPPPSDHPLWTAANLLLSPHVGGNTSAFRPRAQRLAVAQLTRYVHDEPLLYEVDLRR